jgi:tetrahydromethanopterin S-methyltransferase subunit E
MAVGLIIGAQSSTLYSYIRNGEIEKFVAIAYGGRPYTYFTFGIAAFLAGWLILLAGIATGSVRPFRRRRLRRPMRH